MKIGKHLLAGLLITVFVLPVAAQDKQYDVKLQVYSQEGKAEPGAKQKRENPRREHQTGMDCEQVRGQCPETGGKAECCEKAAACPMMGKDHKMQGGKPCGEMQDCGQCDKMQGDKMQGGGQCGEMQGCPMNMKGRQEMRSMRQQGNGMPLMNSVQYREFRRRQLADFYGNRFYLGTNALALVVGMPNINAEWRRDERFGVRLSVGGSLWTWDGGGTTIGGFWFNPELRWYLGAGKGWYAGPMAKVGYIGADGERRTSIAVGATLGYMQRVSRKFAVDYNIGVGFSAVGDHNSYYYHDYGYVTPTTDWNMRFAPLKAGISLVWQTCSKSY